MWGAIQAGVSSDDAAAQAGQQRSSSPAPTIVSKNGCAVAAQDSKKLPTGDECWDKFREHGINIPFPIKEFEMELSTEGLDADRAGDTATRYWLQLLPNARRWRPFWEDANQMARDGVDLRSWLKAGLPDPTDERWPITILWPATHPETAMPPTWRRPTTPRRRQSPAVSARAKSITS